MGAIWTVLSVLLTLGLMSLSLIFFIKRLKNKTPLRIINPLAQGTRYRDGAVTYNQYRGRRYNIEVADLSGQHGLRYQRRHLSKQHKQTKPWEKECKKER